MPLPTIAQLPTPPARSDDPSTFNLRADAFLNALPTLVSQLNDFGGQLPATVNGIDYNGTSTTSLAVGTGSKSLTTQTGKNFQIGQPVRIASTASPANFMDGQVTAYNSSSGALTVNVTAIGGTGTLAAWTISLLAGGGGSFASLAGAETLTNKTLTAPVLSAMAPTAANSGQIGFSGGNLQVADGSAVRTVVTLNGTQTLTNKTLDTSGGNTIKVNGNSFAASAGTATITFPNTTTTLVGRNTTDTLTNKTLTAPTINGGTIQGGATIAASSLDATNTVTDTGTVAADSPGFRGLPRIVQSAAYTLALTDAGKMIAISTGGITIPADAAISFPVGTTVIIYNNSGASQTIAITTDTLYLAGTAVTGTRTLAQRGLATLVKVTQTVWVASGNLS